ncbi:oxygenase MpaB family protein [Microbacterium sp. NPDC058062]|uniref:oxygenase MpaB family protein n=1 Tax=Microbacterium sp. NPDC058062 TaxID=3346320 RepID=UPI0036D7A1C4
MTAGDDVDGAAAATKQDRRRHLDATENDALRQAANWFILAAGTANVIMQLSRPAVAYGVMESKVDEGSLFKNPKRRARTTTAYIAVTMLGGADERAAMRRATNASHARVRSEPGHPVGYNAFDPALQKWVAACLYLGAEQACERVHGPLGGAFAERFYQQGSVFGTTLQLPPDAWPRSRDAFEEYWRDSLADLTIDPTTRQYLMRIVRREYLGRRVPARLLRLRQRLVASYLGPDFRALMQLPWTDADARSFDSFNRRLGRLMRLVPVAVREAPLRRSLRDVQRRLEEGRPLF